MKCFIVKFIAVVAAIFLMTLNLLLWAFSATLALGLLGFTLGVFPSQMTPKEQTNFTLSLCVFFLLAVPVCSFWTFITVKLWRRLWPNKFWFTKTVSHPAWDILDAKKGK